MYGLGQIFGSLHVNKFVYEQNTFLHTGSWIPIFVQSFIFVSYLVFELGLVKLNNNNNKKLTFLNNSLTDNVISAIFLFLLLVTIQTCLMGQKCALIETESET